jgi:DNA (cytosine-5)-methyltransferase 1
MRFIDLFAGIGGIRLGFKRAFEDLTCVFASEWDKHAKITYQANFEHEPAGDITLIKAEEIPPFDILLAGFPCQAFSIAGLRKGFEDTRGTLFFDVVRIASFHKPQVIFLENVKGLKNHDKGRTFQIIQKTLQNMGYFVYHKVLNARDFGVPQNRERIYIVAFRENVDFEFPKGFELNKQIQDCFVPEVEHKYYYNNKPLFNRVSKDITKQNTLYQWRRQYVRENKTNVCPTLTANMGMGGHNVPILLDSKGIRKLTPRECANFQGFPINFKLPSSLTDSALYKQIGNSVSVPVVSSIATSIKNTLNNSKNYECKLL